MAAMQSGESGQDDVSIGNANTVGDFQTLIARLDVRIDQLENELAMQGSGTEQQLATIRVDVRTLQQAGGGAQAGGAKFDLVDTKNMSPTVYSGKRSDNFKVWAKRVKAYTNAKLPGYRKVLDEIEKLGKDTPVDQHILNSWNWSEGVAADSKLHDLLLIITSEEALGVVESVEGRGFEAWRLLNLRFNSVGELYTYDKMNSIMKRTPVKHISEMPAAIAKFEKELKVFREKSGTEFPQMLKLPILMQMIPANWKKEFETQFRNPMVEKTYESLSGQLIGIGTEERYLETRRSGDDMDVDALAREKRERDGDMTDYEKIMQAMYEGQDTPFTEDEYNIVAKSLADDIATKQEQLDYLGKGKGKGKGGQSWQWQRSGGGNAGGKGADAKEIICLWCNKEGHFRKDCKALAKYKADKDAERAKNGDHSPYVPPKGKGKGKDRGPTRGVGSLDGDDYEVIGLTGDSEDITPLDDETSFTFGTLEEFNDYEALDDDDSDAEDYEQLCGFTSEQPEGFDICQCKSDNCVSLNVIDENTGIVTPPKDTAPSRRAVGRDTPMADILSTPTMNVEIAEAITVGIEAEEKKQRYYQCNWDALSVASDSSEEIDEPRTTGTGSTAGSALRTDEPARSRCYSHDAQWQGPMAKPVYKHGWATRRRKAGSVGVQATASTCEAEVQTDPSFFAPSPSDSGDEVLSCTFSDGEEEIDDQEELDIQLTEGERKARRLQNTIPDDDGFFECNPDDVELSMADIRERRFRLRRGVTADSGAGDPVLPRRMVNRKLVRPSAGSKRGLHYVSATNHRIPNVGEVDMPFVTTEEGINGSITFQVADVNKALMSLSDRVDNHCRVVFDQDDETGQDLTHLYDKKLKKKMKLKRVGKVWVLDCSVPASFLAEDSSVFRRPGP